jgi:hypothetical protein
MASLGWGGINDAERPHGWDSEGAGRTRNHDGQLGLGVTRLTAVVQRARTGPLLTVAEPGFETWVFPLPSHKKIESIALKYLGSKVERPIFCFFGLN